MHQTSDPALYRELAAPFLDQASANKALDAFAKDLEDIRKKHRIADLVAILQVSALDEEKGEGVMTASVSFGHPLNKLPLLAEAYGAEKQKLESALGRCVKGK